MSVFVPTTAVYRYEWLLTDTQMAVSVASFGIFATGRGRRRNICPSSVMGSRHVNYHRHPTDTLGAGASFTPSERVEFQIGGLIGVLSGGSASNGVINPATGQPYLDASYDFDDDIVTALTSSLTVKF